VTKSVAGLIGCSGRPLPEPNYAVSFAWFGTAGTRDFNYIETSQIDRGLAAAGATHRLEICEGTPRWAPQDVLQRGIEWMELLAMKAGTRPRDDPFVKSAFDADLALARAEREPLAAVRRYESMARTFDGLAPVDEPRRLAAELRATAGYSRAAEEEARAEAFELLSRSSMGRVIRNFIQTDEPPMAGKLARDLEITSLQRLAGRDSYESLAAQRVLEAIYIQTGFDAAHEVTGPKLAVLKHVAGMIH